MTWHQFRATGGEPLGFLCLVRRERDKPQRPTAGRASRAARRPRRSGPSSGTRRAGGAGRRDSPRLPFARRAAFLVGTVSLPDYIHPPTAAAQALGFIDPATAGIVPAIHPSTTYERGDGQQAPLRAPLFAGGQPQLRAAGGGPDAPRGRRGDGGLQLRHERGDGGLHGPKARRPRARPAGDLLGLPRVAPGLGDRLGPSRGVGRHDGPGRGRGLGAAGADQAHLDRDAGQPDAGRDRHRGPGRGRAPRGRAPGGGLDVRHPGPHAAPPARSGPRDAFRDEIPERALRRDRRHRHDARGRTTIWARIKAVRSQAGTVLGPFEAWLLLRGMRTLFVQGGRAEPGRDADRGALRGPFRNRGRPLSGPPVLLRPPGRRPADAGRLWGHALNPRRGGAPGALSALGRLRIWKRATSLGGVESLVEHRASVEGPQTATPADLLRLSVGLEDVDDLIRDLEQALR